MLSSAIESTTPPAADIEHVPTQAAKDEAIKHFEKGLTLLDEEAWGAALAEFQASLALFQTRNGLRNAGVCYMKLQRFDEALDTYESLLRYPTLPADIKSEAQGAVTELRGRVGTVDITGAEPSATIVVDGTARGEYPPAGPLRVAVGSHVVRVFKEGFEPYQTTVNVAGGKTVSITAKLTKLSSAGRLKVSEQGGRSLKVVVDGIDMGVAPWEGLVAVGNHVVILREPTALGRVGTQPVATQVSAGNVTTLSLRAQDLDSALRVEPRPPGATVFINGVDVGKGQWAGRLRSGKHRVEIYDEGFERKTQEVTLSSGGRTVLSIELNRDEDAPQWKKPSKWVGDVSIGVAVTPGLGLGGEVGKLCKQPCSTGPAFGPMVLAHIAYEFGNGIGIGLSGGYLSATYEARERPTTLVMQPENSTTPTPPNVTVNESFGLRAPLFGLHASYRLESPAITARVVGGLALAELRVDRTGALLQGQSGTAAIPLDPTAASRTMPMPFVAPELRFGWRFTHVELTLGIRAVVGFANKAPRWQEGEVTYLNAGAGNGEGRYVDETLMDEVTFLLAPTAGIRYDM